MGPFGENADFGRPDPPSHRQPGALSKAATRSAHEIETGILPLA
jgi:hypothetical protein